MNWLISSNYLTLSLSGQNCKFMKIIFLKKKKRCNIQHIAYWHKDEIWVHLPPPPRTGVKPMTFSNTGRMLYPCTGNRDSLAGDWWGSGGDSWLLSLLTSQNDSNTKKTKINEEDNSNRFEVHVRASCIFTPWRAP